MAFQQDLFEPAVFQIEYQVTLKSQLFFAKDIVEARAKAEAFIKANSGAKLVSVKRRDVIEGECEEVKKAAEQKRLTVERVPTPPPPMPPKRHA